MKLAAERGVAALISPSEGRRGLRAGATRTRKSRARARHIEVRRDVLELEFEDTSVQITRASVTAKRRRGTVSQRERAHRDQSSRADGGRGGKEDTLPATPRIRQDHEDSSAHQGDGGDVTSGNRLPSPPTSEAATSRARKTTTLSSYQRPRPSPSRPTPATSQSSQHVTSDASIHLVQSPRRVPTHHTYQQS